MADKSVAQKRTRAVVDRIEDGDWAVLLVGETEETTIDLPLSMLPRGTEAGTHLVIDISTDEESRRSAEDRIRALQEELEKRSNTQGKKDFKL